MRSYFASGYIFMKLWFLTFLIVASIPFEVNAQSRSVRNTATTYGARLNSEGLPANLNKARVNNRIETRINNRLSLRIERYRPDSANNPTAAFQATPNDNSRTAPVIASPQFVEDDSTTGK
jgi:hypothetical protein